MEIQEEITFVGYYGELGNAQAKFRAEICHKLGITERTFFNKVKKDSFDPAQKIVISMILKKPIDKLFP